MTWIHRVTAVSVSDLEHHVVSDHAGLGLWSMNKERNGAYSHFQTDMQRSCIQ